MAVVQKDRMLLYAIQSGRFIKVGISANLRQRMKIMALHNPHGLECVMYRYIPRWRARFIEAKVHAELEDCSKGREWFDATPERVRDTTDDVIQRDKEANGGWTASRDSGNYKNLLDHLLAN